MRKLGLRILIVDIIPATSTLEFALVSSIKILLFLTLLAIGLVVLLWHPIAVGRNATIETYVSIGGIENCIFNPPLRPQESKNSGNLDSIIDSLIDITEDIQFSSFTEQTTISAVRLSSQVVQTKQRYFTEPRCIAVAFATADAEKKTQSANISAQDSYFLEKMSGPVPNIPAIKDNFSSKISENIGVSYFDAYFEFLVQASEDYKYARLILRDALILSSSALSEANARFNLTVKLKKPATENTVVWEIGLSTIVNDVIENGSPKRAWATPWSRWLELESGSHVVPINAEVLLSQEACIIVLGARICR